MGKIYTSGSGGGGVGSDEVTAKAGEVLSGRTYVGSDTNDEIGTGTMPNQGAWNGTVARNSTVAIPAGYHSGAGKVTGPSMTDVAAKTITPSESVQTAVAAGSYTTGAVTVAAIPTTHVGSGVATKGVTTITPTEKAQTAVAAKTYVTGDITVAAIPTTYVGTGITRQAAKAVTPTESSQTAVASGVYTTGAVTVNAISSTYVGSKVPTKGVTTITPTEKAQTAVASGVYTTGAITVAAIPTTHVGSGVTKQAAKTVAPTESVQTAVAANVYTTGAVNVGAISSTYVGSKVTKQAAKTVTPSETAQTAVAASVYTTGAVTVAAIPTTHVGSGVTKQAAKTVTPTETAQTAVASGVYTTGAVTVAAISNTYVGSKVTKQAAKTVTPSESAQTAVASGVYTTGAVTVSAISNTYIGSGITKMAAQTITPTTSAQTVSCSGKYMTGNVTVNAIPSTYYAPGSNVYFFNNGSYGPLGSGGAYTNWIDATSNRHTFSDVADLIVGKFYDSSYKPFYYSGYNIQQGFHNKEYSIYESVGSSSTNYHYGFIACVFRNAIEIAHCKQIVMNVYNTTGKLTEYDDGTPDDYTPRYLEAHWIFAKSVPVGSRTNMYISNFVFAEDKGGSTYHNWIIPGPKTVTYNAATNPWSDYKYAMLALYHSSLFYGFTDHDGWTESEYVQIELSIPTMYMITD